MYSLDWSYVHGLPLTTAIFKQNPQDFLVNEFFDEPFSGAGEHILVKIEKKGLTTEEVVKSLARLINRPSKLISYAGLKDRHAITTQWLSIHAPGEEIVGIADIEAPGWRVLESTRHHKKLRPGFLTGNQFVVRLQEVSNTTELLKRIAHIQNYGVPNYFGEQRFGHNANNLVKADELLVQRRKVTDRFLRGMYCSAARSWLFNLILSLRVKENNWNRPLSGDLMQLSGSHSFFVAEQGDEELLYRIQAKDISPASPLAGKEKNKVTGEALEQIHKIYKDWLPWIDGLKHYGLEEAWRANILFVEQLQCVIKDKMAELSFILPAGSYATAVLRELVIYNQPQITSHSAL